MLDNNQLLEVLAVVKKYHTPEARNVQKTVVRLLGATNETDREIESESLKMELHMLLDI